MFLGRLPVGVLQETVKVAFILLLFFPGPVS